MFVCVCMYVCASADSACVGCQMPHCLVTDNETAITIRTCIPIFSQRVLPPLLSSPNATILPVPVKWKPTHAENLARAGHSLPSPLGLEPDQPVSHFSSNLSELHSMSQKRPSGSHPLFCCPTLTCRLLPAALGG